MNLLRIYGSDELASDGYPTAWDAIKDLVREQASHRCVRCGHPYRKGEYGSGEWSPCDERCTHGGPIRVVLPSGSPKLVPLLSAGHVAGDFIGYYDGMPIEAEWRILTVHHLDGDKANCRWWNLTALCQRCHLTIQGKVIMDWPWHAEHSDWFKPYVAGYYAHLLGEEVNREEAEARMDELLSPHVRQKALLA